MPTRNNALQFVQHIICSPMVRHSVYFNYVLVPLDLIINLNRRGIEMYGSSGWFDL